MKTSRLTAALLLTTALTGCDEPSIPAAPAAAPSAVAPGAAGVEAGLRADPSAEASAAPHADPSSDPRSDPRADLTEALRQRLLALDYYASQMWADSQPDAPQAWLDRSAAEHGLTLVGTMPEAVAVAQSVATRRLRVRAEGRWDALLGWLTAVEASPRRFVVRGVAVHRLRGRSVADVQLTALLDRPEALRALGETDLLALDTAGLSQLIERLDADLMQKGQTLDRLGADVSWARPIAAVTEHLPESGRLIQLNLDREAFDARAQRFAGSFTAQVTEADAVAPMVAALGATPGFAQAQLTGDRDVGAGHRRAEVAFTYGQPATPAPQTEVADDAEPPAPSDPGAGLRRNPFHQPVALAAASPAPRPRVVGNVLLNAPRVSGGRGGSATRGPRTASAGRFAGASGFTNNARFTSDRRFTDNARFTRNSRFTNNSRFTGNERFTNGSRFTGNASSARGARPRPDSGRGPRTDRATNRSSSRFDAGRARPTDRGPRGTPPSSTRPTR